MKYETFEIEVDGQKIGVSNDPRQTKNKGLYKQKLYECFLVKEEFYATSLCPKILLESEHGRKVMLLILQREINNIKKKHETT